MSNNPPVSPWDPFPLPSVGDPDERLTYEWVGRVLDQWEAVEFQLSRLYSIFVGEPDGPAIWDYGKGQIFRLRLSALSEVAEKYFVRCPDQKREGDLCRLVREAEDYSARRNEVAHGTVRDLSEFTFFRQHLASAGPDQYALIPPLYLLRKHDLSGHPQFAYTSPDMRVLRDRLFLLSDRIGTFRETLPREQSQAPSSQSTAP